MNSTTIEGGQQPGQPHIDHHFREPSEFEQAILSGLQSKPIYQGFSKDRVVTHRDGTTEWLPDPRIARVDRWRRKNRAARTSRRINRRLRKG